MTTSLILDFETLDTSPYAVITQIAAIAVNRADFVAFASIDLRPRIWEQVIDGRTFTHETLAWHQDKGTLPQANGANTLKECAEIIQAFIQIHNPHRIWAWGKDFERPIIENIYLHSGLEMPPYQHRIWACARDHYQTAFGMDVKAPPRTHQALQDCKDELRDLHAALKEINRLSAI